MEFTILLNASMGLILVLVALPMYANILKPNRYYGFRVRQTLQDPQIWYKVNHYAGKLLIFAGFCITAVAIGLAYIPHIRLEVYSLAFAIVSVTLLTFTTFLSWRYMKSIL